MPTQKRKLLTPKREPYAFNKVVDESEQAKIYVKRHAKRNIKITKNVLVKYLKEFGFKKGRILDAGCGAGEVCIELARAFPKAEIVGIDLGEPILDLARDFAKKAGFAEQCAFQKGDVTKIPFEDDSFDVVVSLNVLHFLDEPVEMLGEIERVLGPDGILFVLCIRRSWIGYILPIFKTAYTTEEVKKILKRSKLRKSDISQTFWAWGIVVPGPKYEGFKKTKKIKKPKNN